MQFHIRALSAEHIITPLIIDARDEADARWQISERGLFVASLVPVRDRLLFPKRRASGFALVLFSQELLALFTAGLSIVEALEALLEKDVNTASNRALAQLLEGLRDGKRFSTVLAEQPFLFSALYIGIIQAAEGTSDLPRSLQRFIDYQQRIDAVRAKLISASIYPLILLAVGGAVSLFLIGYVVPRFAAVYQGTGRALPWLSQQMLDWGNFASLHSGLVMTGVTATVLGMVGMLRWMGSSGIGGWFSRIPGLRERIRIYALSRLYLTLGMLLEGGIPIMPALHTV